LIIFSILLSLKHMKIIIKATNIKLTEALEEWVRMKLEPLARFEKSLEEKDVLPSLREKPRVEIWTEIGKTTYHHRKGDVFRAEIQIRLPKKSIRAEAVSDDLRAAIVEARDETARQLKRYKEKFLNF